MREKREPVLVLCDREEEYAQLMTEFMRTHKDLPWQIRTYTDADMMIQEENDRQVDIMVIAERTYQKEMQLLKPLRTVILMENGIEKPQDCICIDKYQEAQEVLQILLEAYLEIADAGYMQVEIGNTVFIGIYSPVRRCLQTTFAITLSQMLAENHRTLYLNFEHYSGLSELKAREGARDLADLLYFLMAEKGRFKIRLQTIAQHQGNLDYVPPMKSGQNLLTVPTEEWKQLLGKLAETGIYEYVVMDLSESMQGLFEVLRNCRVVFTMTREDRIAQGKIAEYERILQAYSYEDVLSKTRQCPVPKIKRIPDTLEQYARSEMADFVRGQIKELERDIKI